MSWKIGTGALCFALLLTSCATTAPRATLSRDQIAAAEAAQTQREAQLRDARDWSLQGRIAVSSGKQGGSGRIEWRQEGANFEVSLSAPVTRQSWRLSGNARGARLDGVEGGPRQGADAGELLREATGWDIPVVALSEWVRGARSASLGPAAVVYGVDRYPVRIEQGGWVIDYVWPQGAGAQALPSRLDARRGEARVRLIVDQWANGAEP